MNAARLIALDWGTSNLRACLLGERGEVLASRSAAGGIMAVPGSGEGRFEAVLRTLCSDWMEGARLPLIASGMIGSRQGWREAAYLDCPAAPAAAAAQLTRVALQGGGTLHIVPGLICTGAHGEADVMRGEETQLWGAALEAGQCCVLPGTHSKWAWVGAQGAIERFQTYMTGELYAVLVGHSILGKLMQPGSDDEAAFAEGARLGLAEPAQLPHLLFATRTSGLTGRRAPTALPDFLSGLLIGTEIGSARQRGAPAEVVVLGAEALFKRYEQALGLAGIVARPAPADATVRGQWRLAVAAGLCEERAR